MASSSPWWKGMRAAEVSANVYAAARCMFPAPEWIMLEEISIPGTHGGRRADLVAISIWGPTRVVVCEIKATRADFLNELRDPSKRAPGMRFGTEFAFIVPHGLVQMDEIPDGCGLYEVQRNRRIRRAKVGKQKTQAEWSPAIFHNVVKALVYRTDRTFNTFYQAGSEGAKIYRSLFRALGQEWTLDELIDLTRSLYRGLYFRNQDIQDAKLEYQDRLRADPEIQRLRALEQEVTRVCGYSTDIAQRFRSWYAQSACSTGDAMQDIHDAQVAQRYLARIMDRHEQRKRAARAQEDTP